MGDLFSKSKGDKILMHLRDISVVLKCQLDDDNLISKEYVSEFCLSVLDECILDVKNMFEEFDISRKSWEQQNEINHRDYLIGLAKNSDQFKTIVALEKEIHNLKYNKKEIVL